ncbi:MAG: MarR family transcriptional regulator [Saprospiraceae bacterium]|nr:MarR family transcriptional regulator [Saprospiraceae bacterium]
MSEPYFTTIHEIITTGHWITDQVALELKEFGVTEPQYNVLRILADTQNSPITAQEILEKMVQRSSNITRIVDKLVAKSLVTRQLCPSNRRKMDISITPIGCALLRTLDEKVESFHQPFMKNLNEAELEQLKHLIIKLKSKKDA